MGASRARHVGARYDNDVFLIEDGVLPAEVSEAAKVMAAGTSAEAAGAALGGIYWGMAGLCVGWAIAASGEAAVLLPAVIRVFHRDPPAEPVTG